MTDPAHVVTLAGLVEFAERHNLDPASTQVWVERADPAHSPSDPGDGRLVDTEPAPRAEIHPDGHGAIILALDTDH